MSTLHNAYTRLFCSAMVVGTLAAATPARAGAVEDWNALAVGFINQAGWPAPFPPVDLAVMHIAIHDVVQAYQHRFKTFKCADSERQRLAGRGGGKGRARRPGEPVPDSRRRMPA